MEAMSEISFETEQLAWADANCSGQFVFKRTAFSNELGNSGRRL